METHEEGHQPQAQATESTRSETASEQREEEKKDGKTDTRREESTAEHSAGTVDSSQNEAVTTATTTATKEPPVQETDSEENTKGAAAAAKSDLQAQADSSKKKESEADEFPQTGYPEDATKKMKSLQLEDAARNPEKQHPGETIQGQQVPSSKTGKEDENTAVAEASVTPSGTEGKGADEEHGSKKKKKKKKKKAENKEQREEDTESGAKSTESQEKSGPRERNTHTGYILDRHARSRGISEAAKFFLQSLDEESTESEPSLAARFHIIVSSVLFENITKQVWVNMNDKGLTIIHGPDGCGKTETTHFLRIILQHYNKWNVHWCTYSTLPELLETKPREYTVFIMDNFLGHTSFEGIPKWRPIYNILRKDLGPNVHVLLVTRTSTLQQALASTGADFTDLLNASLLVETSVDYQAVYRTMFPEAKQTPDFDAVPDIGIPVCCKLASNMPDKSSKNIFQSPRSFLCELVKGLMEKTAALLSLGLLAVTEGYVNARDLRNPARLKKSVYLQTLQSIEAGVTNEQNLVEIIDFYNETPALVRVEDDFVSFTNEAVREAVLCVLCESHAQFLAKHCSLRLLSRLALVTRDPDQPRDDDEKPTLPASAAENFLQRLLTEMSLRNYRDVLPSALFTHSSIYKGFKATVTEKSLLNKWLGSKDKQGLHFLFWANACKAVTEMLVPLKARKSKDAMMQGVVGSCYWGDTHMFKELLSKLSQDEKKFALTAKIEDIFEERKDFNWDESPLHPEDTLLTLAAWRGKDDVVKELVVMGAEVNSSGHNQITALMHYCARGNEQMVRFLLERRASTHLQDDIGNTALHYALMGGLTTFHEALFHEKALRQRNQRFQTPLIVACGNGAPRKVLDKLRRVAQHKELYRSLLFACQKGKTDMVRYLFETEKKNHPILQLEGGMDAVEAVVYAVRCGKPDQLLEILLPKITSRTPSMELCRLCKALGAFKDEHALKKFLPVVKDMFEYALPLSFACILGNKSVVEYLLENQPTENNTHCILSGAVCMGSWNYLKWALVTANMPITSELICYAMLAKHTEQVKHLLSLCEENNDAYPHPLHLAARYDLPAVIEWLLEDKHKDVDSKNGDGLLPLSVAIEFGSERSVKCLVNYGAKITEDIKEDWHRHRATAAQNDRLYKAVEKTLKFLAEKGTE